MENLLPKRFMVIVSVIQGIVLTLLYQSAEHNFWPGTNLVWLTGLTTFAVCLGPMLLLSVERDKIQRTIAFILPFALLMSALGFYIGWQQQPKEQFTNGYVIFILCFTGAIACFKALMYLQQLIAGEKIVYSALFSHSWRNFIIFSESLLFTGIFFAILQLGAALFAVLDINVFRELLQKDWFVIPVLNLAFGFAVIIFRNITYTADTIAKILQTLFKFLLPAISLVSLAFLATLPFTGLQKLWATGSGSSLVLWLQALTLFFVNAVYQGANQQRPYGAMLHRAIYISVAFLPVYSLIACYGLWLRIDQYGLTVARCWGVLIWLLLTIFTFGYLAAIIKRKDQWLETLSTVNIRMGLTVLVFMLLVNSPLLNFQSLSANSQIERLHDGRISVEDFDYQYFARHLGRAGYLHIQKLRQSMAKQHPSFVAKLERVYPQYDVRRDRYSEKLEKQALDKELFVSNAIFWPSKQYFPDDLIDEIYEKNKFRQFEIQDFYFIAKDLNGDDSMELFVITERNSYTSAKLWRMRDDAWHSDYVTIKNPRDNHFIKSLLDDNQVSLVVPEYSDLQIGDITLRINN
ncbi:DUF4153 domain-containing protein [Thalassotalea sp. HSM 43]|uniref:DUF4153 domain-containing protein n=1 Tax=Thalassotalea sp. HSM 43 TaxID=2552945 RepID=UPI0010807F40|nr:DUF4153 domain-containing protein [Thalassotalea sp. HSM 43]QBY04615.1 DUF4153 domain-containing protein [Thalassotalea sp. HSM 43]